MGCTGCGGDDDDDDDDDGDDDDDDDDEEDNDVESNSVYANQNANEALPSMNHR